MPGDECALGVGIAGRRERLHQLGGRLDITSNRDGTLVRATLPYTKRATAKSP